MARNSHIIYLNKCAYAHSLTELNLVTTTTPTNQMWFINYASDFFKIRNFRITQI